MGRNALAATSLIAAVPAIGLAYVTIMAFVRFADAMPMLMIIVNGAAVVIAVLLAITPVAIVVGKRGDRKAEVEEAAADADEDAQDEEGAESAAHTAEVVADDFEEGDLSEEMNLDEQGTAAETDAYEFNPDEFEDAGAADDAFEFDDEDELK